MAIQLHVALLSGQTATFRVPTARRVADLRRWASEDLKALGHSE